MVMVTTMITTTRDLTRSHIQPNDKRPGENPGPFVVVEQ